MKILFNYNDWNHLPERKKRNEYGGVGYYRIIKPAEQLKRLGYDVTVKGKEVELYGDDLETRWDTIFKEFDVFWTSYFQSAEMAAAIFYHAQKHGKKVVLDCDDNYLDVPDSNPHADVFKHGKKERAFTTTALSFADVITVSTEPLRQKLYDHIKAIHGIEKEIIVLPNMNDVKDWTHEKTPADKFTIGYSGSTSHFDDIRMVLPAVVKIMQKHAHVQLNFIGSIPKPDIKKYFKGIPKDILDRIGIVGATATFKDYPEWLAVQGWDIGIAPLVDTEFTRSKSHIKWLEYSMCGVPVVASRVYPYFMPVNGIETIQDGVTGMLVKQTEWFDVLDELVQSKTKRENLAKNAYKYIKENFQYNSKGFDTVVKKIIEKL